MEELIRLVAPPAVPKNVPSVGEWELYEVALGCAFPSDYKHIINTYGDGWFANWIQICHPSEIAQAAVSQADRFASSMENWGNPYSIFPKANGILICGGDDGNSLFFWHTQGLPDRWTLINIDNGFAEGPDVLLNYSWLELLVGWFAGEITNSKEGSEWYPEDVKPTQERFFRQS